MKNSATTDHIVDIAKKILHFHKAISEQFGIKTYSFHILYLTSERPIAIKDIKKELGLSSASLSRMLNNLYKKGLIQRNFSEAGDKREIQISTSDEGKKLIKAINDKIEAGEQNTEGQTTNQIVQSINDKLSKA